MTKGKWVSTAYCPECNNSNFYEVGMGTGQCECAKCKEIHLKKMLPQKKVWKLLKSNEYKEGGVIKQLRNTQYTD